MLAMGGLSIGASFLPLTVVIDMPTTARILIQFVGQIVALWLLRCRRDPGPYDHDGLESFGARVAGHGPSQASGSAGLLDSKSGPGKENGEPPLGRLPVNRTKAV